MEENIYYLDRATYKKIKGYDRESMNKFLDEVYKAAYNDCKEDTKGETIELDTNLLREKIAQVKGIGETRLNEIMNIIEDSLK